MKMSSKIIHLRKLYLNNLVFYTVYRNQSSTYKNTLLLPQSKFPHKVNLSNRRDHDRKIEIDGKFDELYNSQRSQSNREEFILHDGPPYANGDVHIGHAVNKILKDITVRHQLLSGKKVQYIPGWDCHGLPIELKVLKENHALESQASKIDIRKKAYKFSQSAKEKQMSSFKKWGILADWSNSYFSCKPSYIIDQLNAFQELYEKEIVFRDHKPVFWSPHNRTSLAEAELEYNHKHVSPSIFVKFPVLKCPDALKSKLDNQSKLSIVIWTTTPWSLPANQAVCYAPDKKYCIAHCKENKEFYIVAQDTLSSLSKTIDKELNVVETFEGSLLNEVTYMHPISKTQECPLLPSNHVTMEKGTGLVHTAPNHGLDDYTVASKLKIPISPCIVDERGCYNKLAPKELQGKEVLGSGSDAVLGILKNDVLHKENYTHSYPYDWRSKTPVIIRSCHQWFIDVDRIRNKAIESLETVNVIPEHFKKVFIAQLESSPPWCISRQRVWGVPIPAFYSPDSDKPLIHRSLTGNLCSVIQENGIHSWWEKDTDSLIPSTLRKELNLENKKYHKGSDIMDIWFDSGISWKCVLPEPQISDVCLEGIDQIRGWFNSSLLTSIAFREKAPFKTLILHGFTTDAEGRKMSKSEGNVISPEDIISGSKKNSIPAYGIDVLRWWVATHACQAENIPVKMKIFDECVQNLNKFRNVLKFLLGCLNEFDFTTNITEPTEMRALDLYMLHKINTFQEKVLQQYSLIQYKNASKEILNFVINDVSSFYCHLVKDRLYCDGQYSKERLDCQTVLYFTLNALLQSVCPICPHLASEVFLYHPDYKRAPHGVFTHQWPKLSAFLDSSSIPPSVQVAIEIRDAILKAETKTTDMQAIITCSPAVSEALLDMNRNINDNSGLTEFLQVSDVLLEDRPEILPKESVLIDRKLKESANNESVLIALIKTELEKCPRCRLHSTTSETGLCSRCENVVTMPPSSILSSV